jgi:hypothetical protein
MFLYRSSGVVLAMIPFIQNKRGATVRGVRPQVSLRHPRAVATRRRFAVSGR